MPSPFPGMDPYLEDPLHWRGVHHGLIAGLKATLNAILPKRYLAEVDERVYLVQPDRSVYPDVTVLEQPGVKEPVEIYEAPSKTAGASDNPWVVEVPREEIREAFIEIRPVGDEKRVIAVIELLSPANKSVGSEGRRLYLEKQRAVLGSPTHLIEIDLLRTGEHTVAVPQADLLRKGKWDYLVCLHRGNEHWRYEVWAVTVRQPLPRFCVPLAESDLDAVLDLRAVFNRCYDEGPYPRRIDYRREPPIPLSPEDAAWADKLLRENGLRP